MKTTLLTTLFALALLGTPMVRADEDAWQAVPLAGGKHEVLFPGKPDHIEKELPTPFGKTLIRGEEFLDLDTGVIFMAMTIEYPPALIKDFSRESLDDVARGFVQGMKGKMKPSEKTQMAGNPGREFQAILPAGKLVGRTCAINGKVYVLFAAYPDAGGDKSDTAVRFLDSFKPSGGFRRMKDN